MPICYMQRVGAVTAGLPRKKPWVWHFSDHTLCGLGTGLGALGDPVYEREGNERDHLIVPNAYKRLQGNP
eukprot:315697-Pelagomonas_calceolata.AAC.2